MKHSTFDELKSQATISEATLPKGDVRRRRLLRLALLLENHPGPIKLFRGLEFLNDSERTLLRCDNSPLSIAFADPTFRTDGLRGDLYGQGMEFFHLSDDEAHHMLCDCHFHSRAPSGQMIAHRTRTIANRKTLLERWQNLSRALTSLVSRRLPTV